MKKEEKKSQILWQLFKATFLLSAFTFGGGFVIVSLMKKKFVEELGWLDESEMLDITAIAQSSPGPIPINASVILGYRMCGIPGADPLHGTFCTVKESGIPSCGSCSALRKIAIFHQRVFPGDLRCRLNGKCQRTDKKHSFANSHFFIPVM